MTFVALSISFYTPEKTATEIMKDIFETSIENADNSKAFSRWILRELLVRFHPDKINMFKIDETQKEFLQNHSLMKLIQRFVCLAVSVKEELPENTRLFESVKKQFPAVQMLIQTRISQKVDILNVQAQVFAWEAEQMRLKAAAENDPPKIAQIDEFAGYPYQFANTTPKSSSRAQSSNANSTSAAKEETRSRNPDWRDYFHKWNDHHQTKFENLEKELREWEQAVIPIIMEKRVHADRESRAEYLALYHSFK